MKILVFDSEEIAKQVVPINGVRIVHFKSKGVKVALVRTHSGFYAVDEMCPHLKASFNKGFCTDFDEIVCPLHQYRFSLKTGKEMSGQGCEDLGIFQVYIDGDGLWLELPKKERACK